MKTPTPMVLTIAATVPAVFDMPAKHHKFLHHSHTHSTEDVHQLLQPQIPTVSSQLHFLHEQNEAFPLFWLSDCQYHPFLVQKE